ncbi:hypothetical protein ACVINH_005833 [Rhizobium anhuiense]
MMRKGRGQAINCGASSNSPDDIASPNARENRLLMLYGPTASLRDLLANASRHSLMS